MFEIPIYILEAKNTPVFHDLDRHFNSVSEFQATYHDERGTGNENNETRKLFCALQKMSLCQYDICFCYGSYIFFILAFLYILYGAYVSHLVNSPSIAVNGASGKDLHLYFLSLHLACSNLCQKLCS